MPNNSTYHEEEIDETAQQIQLHGASEIFGIHLNLVHNKIWKLKWKAKQYSEAFMSMKLLKIYYKAMNTVLGKQYTKEQTNSITKLFDH